MATKDFSMKFINYNNIFCNFPIYINYWFHIGLLKNRIRIVESSITIITSKELSIKHFFNTVIVGVISFTLIKYLGNWRKIE